MAQIASHDPLNPINPMLSWVPHPPLGWYLMAGLIFMPRLVSVFASVLCMGFLYHVSKRLYGGDVAKISLVFLLSTNGYMLFSSVAHLDILLTSFMSVSVLSFLSWVRLDERKYLALAGLGLALASMTKYTAAPILLGTFFIWLVFLRKKIGTSKFFVAMAVLAVSLIPLFLWIYTLTFTYGDPVHNYSQVYSLFPSDAFQVGINLLVYTLSVISLWGLPFLSWLIRRPFDADTKLLFVYMAVLFSFFVLITPASAVLYSCQSRYSLPIVPATTIISGKSLTKEKPTYRLIVMILQFVGMTIWSLLMLLYPPFLSLTSDLYSWFLRIIGMPNS